MKSVLSMLCLVLFVVSAGAEPPEKEKAKAKARAALALCQVEPTPETPKPSKNQKVLTDLEEGKRTAAETGKLLVVWVGMDPIEVEGTVSIRQDEHAGIHDKKAAIIYPVASGKLSTNGHVEFSPTVELVAARVKQNLPPPPEKKEPVKSTTTAPDPFFVLQPPVTLSPVSTVPLGQFSTPSTVCVGTV